MQVHYKIHTKTKFEWMCIKIYEKTLDIIFYDINRYNMFNKKNTCMGSILMINLINSHCFYEVSSRVSLSFSPFSSCAMLKTRGAIGAAGDVNIG